MKRSSRLAKLKQRNQSEPRSGHQKNGKSGLPRWALLALGPLLVGGGTLAVFHFFIWNKVPPELVGKWEVQGGPLSGGTFEFSRDGTLKMRHMSQGKDVALDGRVTVEGKALLITTQNPQTRVEKTQRSMIQELTATSLILELEKGDVLKMVRRK
jgi:uncharacterized protein (TIGR03066 family)